MNHHFDYELDGHRRKYKQHCVSNKTGWKVYLTRMNDGFKIPYNALHGNMTSYFKPVEIVYTSLVCRRVTDCSPSVGPAARNKRFIL